MPSVFSLDNSIAEPPRKVAKINQSERPGLYFKIIAKYCLKIDFTLKKLGMYILFNIIVLTKLIKHNQLVFVLFKAPERLMEREDLEVYGIHLLDGTMKNTG
jgi:hypothetical protein